MNLMDIAQKLRPKKDQGFKNGLSIANEFFGRLFVPNLIIWVVTLGLCIVLGNISLSGLPIAIIVGIVFCFILYFSIVWMGSGLVTSSVCDSIVEFNNYESTVRERTKLLKIILALPSKLTIISFLSFASCGVIWMVIVAGYLGMDLDSIILCSAVMYLGTYFCAVYIISGPAQKVSSHYAYKIVEKGVSKEDIDNKQIYSTNAKILSTIHIFVPIVFVGALFFLLAWRIYESHMSGTLVVVRVATISIASVITFAVFSTVLFRRMMHAINNMKELLSGINKESIRSVKFARTDVSNEFMYNVYYINKIIDVLQKILKESLRISKDVIDSSNELSVISNETAVTSLQQNSSVKELLTAMEDADALSKSIAEKIGEVSIVAKKTSENIVDGFDILKQNMRKLDEIKVANDITVDGIKNLTEKISGISDIARIINGIADQTNIIAFNAELEASSAGDIGENFSLVANEIRRLTNSTIQSTNEIRKRISEIQHSSDALLHSSQDGSRKILDGTKIISELNNRFDELKKSSDTMDFASVDIKKIIDQQTASFAQIVVTLRQIAQATETFSGSTKKISESAHNLCVVSNNLKQIQPEEAFDEENAASEVRK